MPVDPFFATSLKHDDGKNQNKRAALCFGFWCHHAMGLLFGENFILAQFTFHWVPYCNFVTFFHFAGGLDHLNNTSSCWCCDITVCWLYVDLEWIREIIKSALLPHPPPLLLLLLLKKDINEGRCLSKTRQRRQHPELEHNGSANV